MEINYLAIFCCFLQILATNKIFEINSAEVGHLNNNNNEGFASSDRKENVLTIAPQSEEERALKHKKLIKFYHEFYGDEKKIGKLKEIVENYESEENEEEENSINWQILQEQQIGGQQQSGPSILNIAICLYSYEAQQPQELSFTKNEGLDILTHSNPDWCFAMNQCGQTGFVPTNYIYVLGSNSSGNTFNNSNPIGFSPCTLNGSSFMPWWTQANITLTGMRIGSGGLEINFTDPENKKFNEYVAAAFEFYNLRDAYFLENSDWILENSKIRRKRNAYAIMDGEDALKDEARFFAQIVKETNGRLIYICGGTVIFARYIITAAHCVRNLTESEIVVFVDSIKIYHGTYTKIEKIISHKKADISILYTVDELPPECQIKISERAERQLEVGQFFGFGVIYKNNRIVFPPYLQKKSANIISIADQKHVFFTDGNFTIADSGGPIIWDEAGERVVGGIYLGEAEAEGEGRKFTIRKFLRGSNFFKWVLNQVYLETHDDL